MWCFRGSSPLTRGKPRPGPHRPHRQRLIPAHAGKTGPSACTHRIPGAHPRSRGENPLASAWRACESGSSPLTRGKLPPRCQRSAQQRLIPAHAGKTFRRKAGFSDWPAHPRSRGENAWTARGRSTGSGSSPLTRGKRGQGDDDAHTWRLIPAHAGKTLAHDTVNVLPQAHPRSRGENPKTRSDRLLDPGSSPLTRGKPGVSFSPGISRRLIPAHAGKTTDRSWTLTASSAHPRSRGENYGISWRKRGEAGSSPLTRGKPRARSRPPGRRGLIPAHAGKTNKGGDGNGTSPAHPRSRGEN